MSDLDATRNIGSAEPAEPAKGASPAFDAGAVRVVCDLSPEVVMTRLDVAARRGRMPGFRVGPSPSLFTVAAFGTPFDGELRVMAEPGASGSGGPTSLRFISRMQRRGPGIFLLLCAITIWPGVWLTDSMLKSYFTSYHYQTWMWYLPFTIGPLPWVWRRSMRKSRAEIAESARSQIDAIARETGGRVVEHTA